MEYEYNSTQFADDAEWAEAINLYRWRNPLNKGHYERRKRRHIPLNLCPV